MREQNETHSVSVASFRSYAAKSSKSLQPEIETFVNFVRQHLRPNLQSNLEGNAATARDVRCRGVLIDVGSLRTKNN